MVPKLMQGRVIGAKVCVINWWCCRNPYLPQIVKWTWVCGPSLHCWVGRCGPCTVGLVAWEESILGVGQGY